jgi:hypothetical protein
MTIAIGRQTVPSETLATSVGAYILVIETVLPDHATVRCLTKHPPYTSLTGCSRPPSS